MNRPSDPERLTIHRRDGTVRQANANLATIGAFALGTFLLLPLYGVSLSWPTMAGEATTAVVATNISFLGLRLIDHRV